MAGVRSAPHLAMTAEDIRKGEPRPSRVRVGAAIKIKAVTPARARTRLNFFYCLPADVAAAAATKTDRLLCLHKHS